MKTAPTILLGAGGHAKVVLDLLRLLDYHVLGVCDPEMVARGISQWRGLPVLGTDEAVMQYSPESITLANGLGSVPGQQLKRRRLHERFTNLGYYFVTLVHPSVILGSDVELGRGVQVMAGVIVQADTIVGDNVILNTGSRIDHDGLVGDHVHVAPGAVVSGNVAISEGCHIGPASVVIQSIKLAKDSVVGAGTTVLYDLPENCQLTGQPPRPFVKIKREGDTV